LRITTESNAVLLLHGTTRERAEAILRSGPDAAFREPNGGEAEGFSTTLAEGPFDLGHPAEYARRKAANFPNEGGPALVTVELSDEQASSMIAPVGDLCTGKALHVGSEVRFELGGGLEELRAAWPKIKVTITLLEFDPS